MSVIKKYQNGKNIVKSGANTWRSDVDAKIKSLKLSKEAEQQLRQETERLANLYEVEGDNIYNIFTEKPNLNTYTVNVDKIKDEGLKGQDWSASLEKIKPNLFGKIKSKGDEGLAQMKGLAASLFIDHINEHKPLANTSEDTKKTLEELGISDLTSEIQNTQYPGQDNFREILQKGKTQEQLQNFVKNSAKTLLNKYVSNEDEAFNYKDKEQAKALLEALKDENLSWDEFAKGAYKLGWNPTELLYSEDELNDQKQQKLQAEQQAQLAEKQKLEEANAQNRANVNKTLLEAQFNPQLVEGLSNTYNHVYTPDNLPQDIIDKIPKIQKIMRDKNAFLLQNDEGRSVIVNKEGFISHDYKTAGSKYLGNKLYHDNLNNLIYVDKDSDKYTSFIYPANGEAYQKIEGSVPDYPGWQILGVPEGDNPDYVQTLVLRNEDGKEIELRRTGDGTYVDGDNNEVEVNLGNVGDAGDALPFNYINNNLGVFQNIKGQEYSNDVNTYLQEVSNLNKITHAEDGEYFANLLSTLKYIANHGKLHLQRRKAGDLYTKYDKYFANVTEKRDKILKRNIQEAIDRINKPQTSPTNAWFDGQKRVSRADAINAVYNKKKGGQIIKSTVKKMQRGGYALTAEDYKEARARKAAATEQEAQESTIKNITSTWADTSLAEKISLGGAAASIIPVLGGVGAVVTTVADLYEDLKDGHMDDGWNHLANLGFIALSTSGFGVLKTAQSAGKFAKIAMKAGKAGKAALKAEEAAASIGKKALPLVEKFGEVEFVKTLDKIGSKILKAEKTSTFTRAGVTDKEFAFLKDLGIVKGNKHSIIANNLNKGIEGIRGTSATKLVNNGIHSRLNPSKLKKLQAFKPVKKSALAREFSGTIDFAKGAIPELKTIRDGIVKGGNIAGGAFMIGNTLVSGYNVGAGFLKDGAEGVDVHDIKNLLYSVGGARNFIRNKQKVKKALSLLKDEESSLVIGSGKNAKSFTLKKEIEIPELKKVKPLKKFSKSAKAKVNKENKAKLKDFKKKVEKITGDKTYSEIIKSGNLKDFKVKTISTGIKTQKESGLDAWDYEQALDALKNGWKAGVGIPSFLRMAKGGIVKLQDGGRKQPTKYANWLKNLELKSGHFDTLQGLNTIKFMSSAITNRKINPLNAQAIDAGRVNTPLVKRTNITATSNSDALFDEKARDMERSGKRIGEATSNLGRAENAKLTAAKYGSDYRIQGQLQRENDVNRLIVEQRAYDTQADAMDQKIIAQNAYNNASANQKQFLNRVNFKQVKDANRSDYIDTWGRKIVKEREENRYGDRTQALLDLKTNPEYINAYNAYKEAVSPEYINQQKNLWEQKFKDLEGAKKPTWEESDTYADILKKQKAAKENWIKQQRNINTLSNLILSSPYMTKEQIEDLKTSINEKSFKRGGSLTLKEKKSLDNRKTTNKILLSEVRARNIAHWKSIELAVKYIANNDKYLQKSLYKIFE